MSCFWKLIALWVLVASLTGPLPVQAADSAQVAQQLTAQIQTLHKIKAYVLREDWGRLFLLEKVTQEALTNVQDPALGLGHAKTWLAFQQLIVMFRYSKSFMQHLDMDAIHPDLVFLSENMNAISTQFGLDDAPYTKITFNVYSQIHKLFLQLKSLTLPGPLTKKVDALVPQLGALMAVAQEGDRPKTFRAAKSVYVKVREICETDFSHISLGENGFAIAIEIEGLNQYYNEVAQNFEGTDSGK